MKHPLVVLAFLWALPCLAQSSLVGIRITPENPILTQGNQRQLSATFNGSPARAVWFSSDPSIAAVDSAGLVSASVSAAGTATITAVSGIFRNSTSVTVVPPPGVPNFFSSGPVATLGQPVFLFPTFSNNGKGVITNSRDTNSLNVQSGTAVQVSPGLGTTIYTLTVTNPAGAFTTVGTAITTVPPPVINSFYPSSQFVTQGNSINLFGSFTGGTANIRTGGGVLVATPSSSPFFVTTPAQAANTTYTLTVTNAAGSSVTANVTVQAVPAPVITSFTASPNPTPTGGGPVMLSGRFPNAGLVTTILPGNIAMTVFFNVGTANVNVTATTTFYLIATNQAGTSTVASVVVTVPAPVPLAINLRDAASFGIASRAGLASTGVTVVNGDVALYPTATCTDATGGPGGSGRSCLVQTYSSSTGMTVNGKIYWAGDPFDNGVTAHSVMNDLNSAWVEGKNRLPTMPTVAGDQLASTTPYLPGVYHNANLGLAGGGVATLDAQNNANAVFIFQVDSSFTDSGTFLNPSRIDLINGAQARNVWFVIGLDATIGSLTKWSGNILAGQTITVNPGSTVNGRVLGGAIPGGSGAVTLTAGAASPSVTTISVP